MRLPAPSARRLAALGFLLALSLPGTALAGWQEDYREGRQAVEENKPGKAEKLLRSAIAEKDRERANAIKASGMFFEPYLPHFYLGLALFQQQQYAEAVRELELSESHGVVTKDPALMAQLNQTRKVAGQLAAQSPEAKGPQASAPPPPQPSAPAVTANEPPSSGSGTGAPAQEPGAQPGKSAPAGGTTGGGSKAEPLKPAPMPSTGPDPALTRAIDAAAGDIAAATKLKAGAGADLQPAEASRLDAATRAVRESSSAAEAKARHDDLRSVTAELEKKVEQRRGDRTAKAALDQARKESAGAVRAGRSLLQQSGDGLKPSEKGRITSGISAVEGARTASAVRQSAKTLQGDVDALRKALASRTTPPAVPDDRKAREAALAEARKIHAEAVQAYFGGDYDKAVAGLEAAGDGIPDDPEIPAMLGSALYKRYILTRSKDAALKARAEAAFRAALSIRPGYALDPDTYPPKVIAFFRQVASSRPDSSGQ